jgi:predicted kinase
MNNSLLVVLVGLPRAGKSTWARKQGYPVVSRDAIRLAIHGQRYVQQAEHFVTATSKAMVRALFGAGHAVVILDGCNQSRKRRDEWVRPTEWLTAYKLFDVAREVCVERAREKKDAEIVPVIERMAAEWEMLGQDEMSLDTLIAQGDVELPMLLSGGNARGLRALLTKAYVATAGDLYGERKSDVLATLSAAGEIAGTGKMG